MATEAKVEDKPENEEPSLIGSGSTEYTLDTSNSVDELSKGILGLLEPAVEEINSRVNDVRLAVTCRTRTHSNKSSCVN